MSFLSWATLTDSVGIEVEISHESSALRKRDKATPRCLRLSQATENFMGVLEAESSYLTMVP